MGQRDLGVEVILPLQDGVKGGRPRHIEHHQRPQRLSVIHTSHVAVALLAWDRQAGSQTGRQAKADRQARRQAARRPRERGKERGTQRESGRVLAVCD